MQHSFDFDLFVIGAGSGGVRAARVAAGYGARVGIAEEHRVGGTCVIRGCVPKKLLVYGAHFAEDIADARRFGWSVEACRFEWPVLRDHVLDEVARLEGLYRQTLLSHGVEIFSERAEIRGPHEIQLASGRTVTARFILIAVGATPQILDVPGKELAITSNDVFHLEALPQRIVIVGGGYIALEFAGIFREFGCQVRIINRTDVVLRSYDAQVRDRLLQIMTSKGIEFTFDAKLRSIEQTSSGSRRLLFERHEEMEADVVLVATGRRPLTRRLGLETAGIQVDPQGAIPVDARSRTDCDSIYAVGDVTNRIQLTPVAIREGQAFADTVFGNSPHEVDYQMVPSAVFSHPPIAAVGMTEEQARASVGSVKIFTSDFRPMKNVLAGRNERALYKMVVDDATDIVLGLHMIGPDAPEILQAASVAIRAGLTKAAFDQTVALHPSMAEELVLLR
jgi:glutathione reductase (NADPH)